MAQELACSKALSPFATSRFNGAGASLSPTGTSIQTTFVLPLSAHSISLLICLALNVTAENPVKGKRIDPTAILCKMLKM